jgi:hypothetical protein
VRRLPLKPTALTRGPATLLHRQSASVIKMTRLRQRSSAPRTACASAGCVHMIGLAMKYAAKLAGSGVVWRIQVLCWVQLYRLYRCSGEQRCILPATRCAPARCVQALGSIASSARHYEGLASHGARNSLCKAHEVFVSIIALLRRPWRVLRLAQRWTGRRRSASGQQAINGVVGYLDQINGPSKALQRVNQEYAQTTKLQKCGFSGYRAITCQSR